MTIATTLVAAACTSSSSAGVAPDSVTSGSSSSPVVTRADPGAAGQATDSTDAAAEMPSVPQSAVDTDVKRMAVTIGGKQVYIRNGGQVNLGGGLAVEIYGDPYPASTLRSWLDMYLTRDGEPITDAGMGIQYDMLAMVHGPFTGEAQKLGGGHYRFTLDYIMFGAWEQTVTIRMGTVETGLNWIDLPVLLVAYPSQGGAG